MTEIETRWRDEFERFGFVVARALFTPDETAALCDHYMALRRAGSFPGDMVAEQALPGDPLDQYPRMIHMHRWDTVSLAWFLDARITSRAGLLLGHEPLGAQTMLYFKPPGSRGQALHQDNFYLRTRPTNCLAAWLALDPSDEAVGCMRVVPGSHRWPIMCTVPADQTTSITSITVPLPDGVEPVSVLMDAGDVLFFGGNLVHGSGENRTAERFRRSLIAHFVDDAAAAVSLGVQPLLRADGSEVNIPDSEGGAPCGVWAERNGCITPELDIPRPPANTPQSGSAQALAIAHEAAPKSPAG